MKGRKPHSTRRKKIEGNPGKRAMVPDAELPEPTEAFDEPPLELTGDEDACDEWRRIAPMLRKARLVADGDRGVLIAICLQWSRYAHATRDLRERGLMIEMPAEEVTEHDGSKTITTKTYHPYPIQNPYLSISNKALTYCLKMWAELGLTPSSRSRVKPMGSDEGDKDGFGEFDD